MPERGVRRARGLKRRLEQLFNRVDASQDGRVEADELTAAVDALGSSRKPAPCRPWPTSEPPATSEMSASATMTVAFVAVRQNTFAAHVADTPQQTISAAA